MTNQPTNAEGLNAYRLSSTDEQRIVVAIERTVRGWVDGVYSHRVTFNSDAILVLQRVAAHSLGCSIYDLRDSECLFIDKAIDAQRPEFPV